MHQLKRSGTLAAAEVFTGDTLKFVAKARASAPAPSARARPRAYIRPTISIVVLTAADRLAGRFIIAVTLAHLLTVAATARATGTSAHLVIQQLEPALGRDSHRHRIVGRICRPDGEGRHG